MKYSSNSEYEKKINLVLPSEYSIGQISGYKVAVFVHLYYMDSLNFYLDYILRIPDWIDIYFTYSDEQMVDAIISNIRGKKGKLHFFKKNNRGRDISALLVSFRKEMLKYEIVCFVHDKREKTLFMKEGIEHWVYNIWENMLGSTDYILNILYTFQMNEEIGLLVPPAALDKTISHAYKSQWMKNYENTVKLAKNLDLHGEISIDETPMTLGTVFWAKSDALKKLLLKNWKYEDFHDEPLPNDGTLSHAIERILEYVCQDAGYDTRMVMTDSFASVYISDMKNALRTSMGMLRDKLGIDYILEIDKYYYEQERMKNFFVGKKNIYIYGAGDYGCSCLKLLRDINLEPAGIIVTKKNEKNEELLNLPIVEISQVKLEKEDGVIIAVNYKYREEIIELLKDKTNLKSENIIKFSKLEY